MTTKADAVAAVQRITAVPAILNLITEMTGLRLSLVAEVTDDRWLCCAVNDKLGFGLEVNGELDVNTTMCKEARATRAPVITSHASQDPLFCDHATPKMYGFESYISVPIILRDQRYFGNLCALDANPIEISAKIRTMFELFADMIGKQLEVERDHEATNRALLDANATAELREQFIAMLGHDLRNPLGAIKMGAFMLAEKPDAGVAEIGARIQRSADSITHMVDDLLDFARGRLGGGMSISHDHVDVADVVRNVVDEQRPTAIAISGDALGTIRGDRGRIAQALGNLLSNARSHGTGDIRVAKRATQDSVEIAVSNAGAPIPADRLATIFAPYKSGPASRAGLGLGLYIVSEIARAHGGSVACASTPERTTFTLALPR